MASYPGFQIGQPPKPQLPEGFAPFATNLNSGYSLSYSGGDKDRLMGKDAYTMSDFPDFMQRGAPVKGLQSFNQGLPGMMDFGGVQGAFDTMQQGQMSAAKSAANSAARAAANRAMLSGGQVGADFARASALQPFFRQQAQQNLDVQGLRLQNQQNLASLQGNVLSQIAGLRAQNRQNQQNYAVNAAQLAQKRIGIGGSVGYGEEFGPSRGLQDQLLRAQIGQMTPDIVKPGYITNAGGVVPGSVNGQNMLNRAITGDLPTQRLY